MQRIAIAGNRLYRRESRATTPRCRLCPQADLADAPSLTCELNECDAAFYLVHSMMSAGGEYAQRAQQLALTFARAEDDAGVKRIIYLGGLGETVSNLSEHLSFAS